MSFRVASVLFTLALPALAQEPAAENLFYKAFWLERGERDIAGAMSLYEQFLGKAPDHALAKQAAQFQFELLTRTGKTKEAEAFAQKHSKLLGSVAVGAPAGAGRGADAAAAPRGAGRGEGRPADAPRGAGRGEGPMANPEERLADLKKQLAEAKAAGDDEQAQRLERMIQRIEQMGQAGGRGEIGGRGEGGQGGPGGRFGRGGAGVLLGDTRLADLNEEQLKQFKDSLDQVAGMMDRMTQRMTDEQKKAFDDNMAALKKSLADGKIDDAQKALDKIREAMPRRRGGN